MPDDFLSPPPTNAEDIAVHGSTDAWQGSRSGARLCTTGQRPWPRFLLHTGAVMHIRHVPFRHRFVYRLWMLSVDLAALGSVRSRLFRHNRFGVVSLWDRDHGPCDGSELAPWVRARLDAAGLAAYGVRIRILFIPRVLGYAFNPIAFYFCHDAAGRLGAVLHQVKNTFGDQVAYLMPVQAGAVARQACRKRLHVSPFFDMQGGYRFAFTPPEGEVFALSIRYGAAVPRLTATLRLRTLVFSDAGLLRLLLAMPLMPLKVVAAIHWQALRLWLRGAAYHRRPPGGA